MRSDTVCVFPTHGRQSSRVYIAEMRFHHYASVLCLALVLIAPAASAAMKYSDELLVYTSDRQGFPRERVKGVFDAALRGDRPVILFIHGRGDEPQKSLVKAGLVLRAFGGGKAVAKLEAYGCHVIFYNWDSRSADANDRARPLGNMARAQERFGFVLDEYKQSLTELRAAGIRPQPVTLLAHSMGTIVLQRLIEARQGWDTNRLFDNVVLTSADADDVGHAAWVDRIARVERVFITVNPGDKLLAREKNRVPPGTNPLGVNPGSAVSETATYVHFRVGEHEVFAKSGIPPELVAFFDSAFHGQPPSHGPRLQLPGQQFNLK